MRRVRSAGEEIISGGVSGCVKSCQAESALENTGIYLHFLPLLLTLI